MKHIKVYENTLTVNSVKTMVKDFRKLLLDLEPYIYEKYEQLANDPNYEAEFGDQPCELDDISLLELSSIGYTDDEVQMVLHYYDDGAIVYSFYILISNDELEDILMKMNLEKYNL